jgi:hypothetical protein
VTARRLSRWLAGTFALGLAIFPAAAQYGTTTPDAQPNNYPPALPPRANPGPLFVFERVGEIALPGPLAARSGWIADGLVVIPVESGLAKVRPEPGATPSVSELAEPLPETEWVESPGGTRRYRTTPEGLVEAQHRKRPGSRWHKSWRIVAPNSILAPPILLGPRLCYTGLDDCVTCVRASNGHRLWAVDLGDRLSRALSCWPSCTDRPVDGSILLAVPDDGASVIALDAYDGRRIASFELPAHGRFASTALVVSGGRIAIARKGYDDKEAALVLLRLAPPPPPAPAGAVPYNKVPPAQTPPSGR